MNEFSVSHYGIRANQYGIFPIPSQPPQPGCAVRQTELSEPIRVRPLAGPEQQQTMKIL